MALKIPLKELAHQVWLERGNWYATYGLDPIPASTDETTDSFLKLDDVERSLDESTGEETLVFRSREAFRLRVWAAMDAWNQSLKASKEVQ